MPRPERVLFLKPLHKLILREDRNAQLRRLFVLGGGGGHIVVHQETGLFGHAARHLAAVGLHVSLEGIPVFKVMHIPGDDEGEPLAGPGGRGRGGLLRDLQQFQQLLQGFPVLRVIRSIQCARMIAPDIDLLR